MVETFPKREKLPAPEALLLNRLEWDYFCTLTFAPTYQQQATTYRYEDGKRREGNHESNTVGRWYDQKPEGLQVKAFHSWINGILNKLKVTRDSLYWVRRWEKGYGGRLHFHALLRFHDRKLVNKMTQVVLRHLWSLKLDMGHADIRAVHELGGCSAYITKVQNDYEMQRFRTDRFAIVEFSKSTQKALRRTM